MIKPSDWVDVGGLNLESKAEVNQPIPIMSTSATTTNFLGLKTKVINMDVNKSAGTPLYRKLENMAPSVRKVRAYGSFFTYLRTPTTTSRKPEVIGMSCQRVIPMAPTNGVMQRAAELQPAALLLNKELANSDTENERSWEKKSVAISGCDPLIVRNFTTIAQMAVDSLEMSPLLAISMTPNESAE